MNGNKEFNESPTRAWASWLCVQGRRPAGLKLLQMTSFIEYHICNIEMSDITWYSFVENIWTWALRALSSCTCFLLKGHRVKRMYIHSQFAFWLQV